MWIVSESILYDNFRVIMLIIYKVFFIFMNKYLDLGYQYKDIFFIIKKSSPYRIEELTRGYMNFKAKSFSMAAKYILNDKNK